MRVSSDGRRSMGQRCVPMAIGRGWRCFLSLRDPAGAAHAAGPPGLVATRSATAALLLAALGLTAGAVRAEETAAERGYRLLTAKPFLPADFDQELFDNLWTVWPEELKEQARDASGRERRQMAFARYGLVENPASPGVGPALGYVSDGKGGWVMNCLACHSGEVAGRGILGSPNGNFALETLTEDVRALKLKTSRPLSHLDLGSLKMPLGGSRGTTNSVMFGVALGSLRDKDLNLRRDVSRPQFVHNDVDPPAFWNVRRKKLIYSDGFAVKSHRLLLQFVMLPRNSGATLRGWEGDFRDILAWIESLEAPAWPWEISRELAEEGRVAFERTCARCHGTYAGEPKYPNRIVPLEEVQTDPRRLESLTPEYRRKMGAGWFGNYGREEYIAEPGGYVAPPLNGIWASAPYFHNGSVPTLWHVLHVDRRPAVWRRSRGGYDRSRVGLEITSFDEVPAAALSPAERREYFDTHLAGKSAAGHPFPDELTESEKEAVLEYLKSL